MNATLRRPLVSERGQVLVIFALLVPMILALGGVVIGIGNWYVHGKNLQTKADAGALGGGNAWSFPCVNTDTSIVDQARLYAGPTTATPAGVNPQVGGVPSSNIHTVLNGTEWYDDDSQPAPVEFTSPSGPVCDARILDVKSTEDNSFPLASLIPLFPDIKRKARVRIEGPEELTGLLPIAVRVPKPVSAAALYVNETPGPNYGEILSARYFRDVCEPPPPTPGYTDCITPMPTGLDHWTTDDGSANGDPDNITSMPSQVGIVVGLSFRRACPGTNPCFSIDTGTYPTVDQMCNQGTSGLVQCFYTTGSSSQTFQSGLQFIRSYGPADPDGAPDLLSAWLDTPTGTNCNQGYFDAPVANNCNVLLNVDVDPGNATAGNIEIRYKLVAGNTSGTDDDPIAGGCNNNYDNGCDLTNGPASVELASSYARHAFAIRVRVQNTVGTGNPACVDAGFDANCQWFFTAAGRIPDTPPTNSEIFDRPVQRAFMGDINRSGSVKFLHLYNVDCGSGATITGSSVTGEAASVPSGQRCFELEMGLTGALARAQDEDPIQLNIGATSQSSVLDCDESISNLKDEIVMGCGGDDQFPTYKKHNFALTPYCPTWNGIQQFFSLPKPYPWDSVGQPPNGWAPFTCVATQTAASPNQIIQGFNERFFGDPNSPSCPADNDQFVQGRNYWHDANNEFFGDPDGPPPNGGPEPVQNDYFTFADPSRGHGNHLRNDDKRFVLLFITPYNSFTGSGNEIYPITLIGGFYITGYGRILGNGTVINDDPCNDGNGAYDPSAGVIGVGNLPPPDMDRSTSGAVAWGHFVVPVDLGASGGGNGELCEPSTPTTCVAVLIE